MHTVSHSLKNYIKSLLFIATFVGVCKYCFCKAKNIRGVADGYNSAICGFFSSLALFFESAGRRQEISLFITPRFLETLWKYLRLRYVSSDVEGWQLMLFMTAMGVLNHYYVNDV